MPGKPWKYYQEWHDTLFFHWVFPEDVIAPLIPKDLALDTFEGNVYVSLVAFTVKRTRMRFLPSVKPLSEFNEVNLRTYVIKDGVPGIYFLSIESDRLAPMLLSRTFLGFSYKKADIIRKLNEFVLTNAKERHFLFTKFLPLEYIQNRTGLDRWLTERYCVYQKRRKQLYRIVIHHCPWPLKNMKMKKLVIHYQKGALRLSNRKTEDKHFSTLQQVLIWGREKC